MILYKYVSLSAAERILATNTIGFSQPLYFNDPFDRPTYPEGLGPDEAPHIFARLRLLGKNQVWSENTGVLSLTRTPSNALMWAHYADKHRGMVIGIDMIRAGLTCERTNFIPAQFGSVIYVSRRSETPFISRHDSPLLVGGTYSFPREHYEKLQRLFLHKPLYWAYEEEVRVLKCLRELSREALECPSGAFDIVSHEGRDLYLFRLPASSIKEVYCGFNCDDELTDPIIVRARTEHSDASFFQCNLTTSDFAVGHSEYFTVEEHTHHRR